MKDESYYRNYVKYCYNTLESLNEQLHNAYIKRNNHANILYANLNILEANNISKSVIDDIVKGKRVKKVTFVKEIECNNRILSDVIRINLNQFLFISLTQIPKLIAIIKYYDWACRIPKVIFTYIHHSFNKELAKDLIRGNSVHLGTYLGKLQVVRLESKDGIDYRASFKYYQQLVEQGLSPKTAKNPNGCSWFIRATKAYHWKVKWLRIYAHLTIIPNLIFYKFRKADQNRPLLKLIAKHGNGIEDLIEDDSISLGDKLNAMINYDTNIIERYKPYKGKKNKLKDNEYDEYVRPKLD